MLLDAPSVAITDTSLTRLLNNAQEHEQGQTCILANPLTEYLVYTVI